MFISEAGGSCVDTWGTVSVMGLFGAATMMRTRWRRARYPSRLSISQVLLLRQLFVSVTLGTYSCEKYILTYVLLS